MARYSHILVFPSIIVFEILELLNLTVITSHAVLSLDITMHHPQITKPTAVALWTKWAETLYHYYIKLNSLPLPSLPPSHSLLPVLVSPPPPSASQRRIRPNAEWWHRDTWSQKTVSSVVRHELGTLVGWWRKEVMIEMKDKETN